jgi:hypothetical protein
MKPEPSPIMVNDAWMGRQFLPPARRKLPAKDG